MSTTIKQNSSNALNQEILKNECQVNEILRTIAMRWKMQILYSISQDIDQFSKLKGLLPDLSDQVLGKRLSELVGEELLVKGHLKDTTPPQIKYKTTAKGDELLLVVASLHRWGRRWE